MWFIRHNYKFYRSKAKYKIQVSNGQFYAPKNKSVLFNETWSPGLWWDFQSIPTFKYAFLSLCKRLEPIKREKKNTTTNKLRTACSTNKKKTIKKELKLPINKPFKLNFRQKYITVNNEIMLLIDFSFFVNWSLSFSQWCLLLLACLPSIFNYLGVRLSGHQILVHVQVMIQ